MSSFHLAGYIMQQGNDRKNRAFILVVATVPFLVACSGGSSSKVGDLEQSSAREIFEQGELELARGDANDAAGYFEEIERLFPYSEYAKRGLIMQAYAYHQDREYDRSRAAAQRFLSIYPADGDAAYAQYLLALSYYDQIDDVGRDQGVTRDALKAFRDLFERYPNSEYARSAELKYDLAFDHLAAKEMEVGRYYLKRGHYASAASRFRTVVEVFQTTSHTPEALHRLVESYLALGAVSDAQAAGAILGYNYRSSEWYEESYRLLAAQNLEAEARGDGWLTTIYRQTVRGEWL